MSHKYGCYKLSVINVINFIYLIYRQKLFTIHLESFIFLSYIPSILSLQTLSMLPQTISVHICFSMLKVWVLEYTVVVHYILKTNDSILLAPSSRNELVLKKVWITHFRLTISENYRTNFWWNFISISVVCVKKLLHV